MGSCWATPSRTPVSLVPQPTYGPSSCRFLIWQEEITHDNLKLLCPFGTLRFLEMNSVCTQWKCIKLNNSNRKHTLVGIPRSLNATMSALTALREKFHSCLKEFPNWKNLERCLSTLGPAAPSIHLTALPSLPAPLWASYLGYEIWSPSKIWLQG